MAEEKKKIEQLTEEQKARFPEFVEKWTKIGLSTEPTDKATAEEGARKAYEIAGVKCPPIHWCRSPFEMKKLVKEAGRQVYGDEVDKKLQILFGYGQHDASWLAFYDYFKEVCGLVEETKKLEGLWLIAKSAGWFAAYDTGFWISERPVFLSRDDRGRLHNDTRMAIEFSDGMGVYAIHGVRIQPEKAHIITDPSKITIKEIDAETNSEIKRVMMDKYGLMRYLKDSNAALVDEDTAPDGSPRRLYRKPVRGDEDLVMLEVKNSTPEPDGSIKTYTLRIDPQCRPMLQNRTFGEPQKLTCQNAVASTFGMRGEEYELDLET
jgi:hypothetical protein